MNLPLLKVLGVKAERVVTGNAAPGVVQNTPVALYGATGSGGGPPSAAAFIGGTTNLLAGIMVTAAAVVLILIAILVTVAFCTRRTEKVTRSDSSLFDDFQSEEEYAEQVPF